MMGKTSVLGMGMLLGLAALPITSVAQEYSYENAYIHYVDGDVTLQRATEPEPEPGAINVPILHGDRLWTHAGSRVAIRFADGTILRLDERTKVDFVTFDGEPNILLWSGSVILKLGASSAKPRIDSPTGSVYPQLEGTYRIDVRDAATMTLSVGQGRAELASTEGSVIVGAGEQSFIEASQEPQFPSTPLAFDAANGDAFEQWSAERDLYGPRRREVPLAEVPEEVHHYVDELSEHGEWREDEEQGYAWYPSVSVGWAPYRHGRWGYTHYGYTWISYEPWGWAPYHYGRWGYNHHGWHWVPGRHWGPAWVSFAIGPTWVGWSPLGYHAGSVFSYASLHHGHNYYGYRGRYRGGKAVPRHVYDNGAGWNFSRAREFGSRAGHARLRVDQVRSTSSAAALHRSASVLDRSLTPHALDARGKARGTLQRPRGVILRAARTPSARARTASPEASLQRARELVGRANTKVIRRNNNTGNTGTTERAAARRLSTGRSAATSTRRPSSSILRATTRSGSQEGTASQLRARTFRTPTTTGSRSGNRSERATPTRTPRAPAATTARPATRSRTRSERVTTPRTVRTPTATGRPANRSGNRSERATPTRTFRTPSSGTTTRSNRSGFRTQRASPSSRRRAPAAQPRPRSSAPRGTTRSGATRSRPSGMRSAPRPSRGGSATRGTRSPSRPSSSRGGRASQSRGSARSRSNNNR